MKQKIQSLAVFCGSMNGIREDYRLAAEQLADCLIKNEIALIYGGAKVGLMGVMADRMLQQGGKVIGIIPEHLVKWEVAHNDLTELHIVSSMHERKSLMATLADAFVILPGGVGSLDEFFEIFTWAKIKLHEKPFGLLNVANYFQHLLNFIDHAVAEGFLHASERAMMSIEYHPETLVRRFL
jgi:uncharacterized protein (TIGR00730 family)